MGRAAAAENLIAMINTINKSTEAIILRPISCALRSRGGVGKERKQVPQEIGDAWEWVGGSRYWEQERGRAIFRKRDKLRSAVEQKFITYSTSSVARI